jgi:hypothetical protein
MKPNLNKELNDKIKVPSIYSVVKKFDSGSISFNRLLDEITNFTILYDDAITNSTIIGNNIVINMNQTEPNIEKDIIRMCRMAWHLNKKTYYNPHDYYPDHALLLSRSYYVDSLTFFCKVVVEYSVSNNDKNIIARNYTTNKINSIMQRSTELIKSDFRFLHNGRLCRVIYNLLFDDCVLTQNDNLTIKNMLASDYIERDKLPDTHLHILQKIGEQPIGNNYMKYREPNIHVLEVNDAAYLTINDRSLSNYFWFLKFEHSVIRKEEEIKAQEPEQNVIEVDFGKK